MEFYAKWMKYGDRSDAEMLQGPILNPGSRETDLSDGILDLARNVLLKDADYIERVKRHYRMFRERVEAPGGASGKRSRAKKAPGTRRSTR